MKKNLLSVLVLVSLAAGMIHADSKFKYIFNAIEKQDRPRVKKGLLEDEVLTPEQFKQLIGVADEIHKKLAESLSITTSKKDLAMLIIGSLLAYVLGEDLVKNVSIWQGWTKQVPDDSGWNNRFKPVSTYRDTTAEERSGYWLPVLLELGGSVGFCYMALRGYQCAYGSVPVENARLILEALKKAEKLSSSDLG